MAKTRPKVLSIVLAGGEGKRLMPLTMDRAKPAVPFGGTYRLIDFVLSNLANSGLTQIAVLTQYKSHSLDRHISITWRMSTMLGSYVTPVPAQQRLGPRWYQGSADAIYQSLNLINDQSPDYVVVFGADNIYRMDVDAMLQYHIDSGLGCTVAGIRVPRKDASAFGIIDADQNHKITEFLEKPADPPGLPDASDESFASMGNYIFSREALVQALHDDAHSADSRHDMGGDVIPRFVNAADAQVYDFRDNEVPGNTEKDADYWRDVGTLDSYYESHMDLIRPLPVFNLYNYDWPIYTHQIMAPPARTVRGPNGQAGVAFDSIVSPGVLITGGHVGSSVLSPKVKVEHDARVTESVLMQNVQIGAGATVHRCILDKNVVVPPGFTVGLDREQDLARGLTVTESGLTIAPKNYRFEK